MSIDRSTKLWFRSSADSAPASSAPSPASSMSSHCAPMLTLTAATRESFEHAADSALQEAMQRYHTYREQMQRRVPSNQWRQVKRVANLVAYKERPVWRRHDEQQQQLLRSMSGPLALVHTTSKSSGHAAPKTATETANVLVVGSLQGSLDDEMYGVFVDSGQAARLRSSYLDDGLQDFQWLATLRTPTREDPFRSCGVARAVLVGIGGSDGGTSNSNGGGGMSRFLPVVGRRELCFIVSMGITKTPSGERVGYYVLQSVSLDCDLVTIATADSDRDAGSTSSSWLSRRRPVRATTSMCWLKCELREPVPRLELFALGFLAPMGSSFGVAGMALRAALSIAMTSDVSYAKKLHWMMHDALDRTRRLTSPHGDCLGQCKTPFGASTKSLGRCVICRATVCRSCRIDRRITVDISADGAQQLRCGICVLCMSRAKQTDAAPFVAREAPAPSPSPGPVTTRRTTPTPPLTTIGARRRRATATSARVRSPADRSTVPSIAVL